MGCNAWNHPASCNCGWGGDTGSGWTFAESEPHYSLSGKWGRYEAARLGSYTIPNARCPVCHAPVFFYQSEYGGRVFFDPPLGPPWPKHPCTDNRGISSSAKGPAEMSPVRLEPLPISAGKAQDMGRAASEQMAQSGWHPLLELRVRNLGKWQVLEGLDPIEDRRCQVFIRSGFREHAPTFFRVEQPGRLLADIQQVQLDSDDQLHILTAKGWFGAADADQARIAKAARAGDVEAMRRVAQARSYLHLGRENRVSDVAQFIDSEAALHWFGTAADRGSEVAKLEKALLLDLLDQDAAFRRWRRANPKALLQFAPAEIRDVIAGSLAHGISLRVSERLDALNELLEARRQYEDDFMDSYYIDETTRAEEYLNGIAGRPGLSRLADAIHQFLHRTRVPPFTR